MGAKTGAAPKIRALHSRYPDLSNAAIAKRVGCSNENVRITLASFLDDKSLEDLRDFQETKADVFDSLQLRMLASITKEKIDKTRPVEAITAAAILEDKARLVRGQATNINATILLDVVEALKNRRQ